MELVAQPSRVHGDAYLLIKSNASMGITGGLIQVYNLRYEI
jgi:hypothetical protein